MARQGIFTGFTPNDGLGDSLASGAVKVNANFQEIYDAFGDGNNLSPGAGAGGTWSKASTYGISTSKYVGIGTELPTSQLHVLGNSLLQGITTGTFVGDGSGLTGVTATGSGVIVKDNGVQRGVAETLNFGDRINVGNVFQGNVDINIADYVAYATVSGIATYAPVAGIATLADNATNAGVATYAPVAGVATFATTAGIVTYASASGVATNAGVAEYAKLAGVSTYAVTAGVSTTSGYAPIAGVATVAQNLTGNPSITIENINSITGIVTVPGQGSKMRFDFDSTGDLPNSVSWRGMFAYANNTKAAYVSFGTTNGGYNGWRKLLAEDIYGNYQTTGIITASAFAGDASGLYNLPSTDAIWRSNPTGIVTASNVGIGTTNAEEALNVLGNFRLKGRIVGTATTNILPFLYATYADLPDPSVYHGAFAHVHETGKAYFAHSGQWVELVNIDGSGVVGTGTETYNVGHLQADQANVLGIVTAVGFYGDGSGLTGITASGTGIEIKDEGTVVGTAGTINFVGSAVTTTFGSGIATVTISSTGGGATVLNDLTDVVVSGANINDTLKYNGSVWTSSVGLGTVNGDDVTLSFGAASDLKIYHSGNESYIKDTGSGSLNIDGSAVLLQQGGSTKLQTTPGGVTVSGVLTATSFVGDGSGLTGVSGGSGVGPNDSVNTTGIITAAGFSGDFYITESIDDNTTYNVMMLGESGGGSAYRALMVDSGGITFNPGTNTLFVNNVTSAQTITANAFVGDGSALTNLPGGSGGVGTDGSINTTGIITANGFYGDGSGLTGVVGSGSGVVIQDSGTPVGTAGTINFDGELTVTPVSAGVVTVTAGGLATGVTTFTAVAAQAQTIDTWSASTYSSGEYTVVVGTGTYRQMQKFTVMHDAGDAGVVPTAYYQEYGIMYSPVQIVSISAVYSGGNIVVSITPESGISGTTTCRFTKSLLGGI
jgi:hypothetical protein